MDIDRDLLSLAEVASERYPHLHESVAHGTEQARYDILFAFPDSALTLDANGRLSGDDGQGGGFLEAFDRWWQREAVAITGGDAPVPFRGGWFVYLGYELAAEVEPVLDVPPAEPVLPTAFAVRCPAAIVRDHERRCLHLVAEPGQEALLERMTGDLERGGAECPSVQRPALSVQEDDPRTFLDGVARVRRYIADGDVFQVNLSRRWCAIADEAVPVERLYRLLRRHNPAPFAGLSRWQDTSILSSSPERLVQVGGGRVQTRPIAGTRPRGIAAVADQAYSRELLGHPKERAEHVMLIDLERNDLGRVCRPGSAEVNELMVLETYAHVHHIVSNVRGVPVEGITPGQVIRAVFPGGTITGCPKIRCMEIIAELEREGRGAYTGSMGYVNRDGDLDLNILIRTLVNRGNGVTLRTGAGIVADSIAERELAETRAKARGLLLALGAGE
ncbi:MAG: aminodeoxychorismate synthase component I [Gammaproteobacteria bacterium]